MSAIEIYFWFVLLPGIGNIAVVLSILSGSVAFFSLSGFVISHCDNEPHMKTVTSLLLKVSMPMFVFLLITAAAIPSTQQMAAIFGAELITSIEGVEQIPQAAVNKILSILEVQQ